MKKHLKKILICIVVFFILIGFEPRGDSCGGLIKFVIYPKEMLLTEQIKECEQISDVTSCRMRAVVGACTGPELRIYFRPITWLYEIKNLH